VQPEGIGNLRKFTSAEIAVEPLLMMIMIMIMMMVMMIMMIIIIIIIIG
jgi:hypothetical protein